MAIIDCHMPIFDHTMRGFYFTNFDPSDKGTVAVYGLAGTLAAHSE